MFYEPAIRGKRDQLSPIFQEFLGIAESVPLLTSVELLNAWAELDLLRQKTLAEMSDFPVWLCPVASIPAFRHDERAWTIDGETFAYLDAMRYTRSGSTRSRARRPWLPPSASSPGLADRRADCGAAIRR